MPAYPKRLLLVRHGETDWNRKQIPQGHVDIPLNSTGQKQAHALALRLQDWEIDALYSSDLARAAQTATILSTALALPVQVSAAWREIDLGAWCGLTRAEVKRRFPHELEALARGEDIARGGGENMAAVQARAAAEYQRLEQRHVGESVLIVSHGGTLKALICHLIGLKLQYASRLSTGGNTGLSIIQFDRGWPQLTLLNDFGHLTEDSTPAIALS
jgi:broad specificity phosphatase PhoE